MREASYNAYEGGPLTPRVSGVVLFFFFNLYTWHAVGVALWDDAERPLLHADR